MFAGLVTIIGGILAASSLIIARKPNAKDLIDKLTPYQGWIGVAMFFWGIWGIFDCLRNLAMLSGQPILWVFWMASSAVDLVVGFLLGFGLITKYALGSSVAARARGQLIREKLAGYQGMLGLAAIALGALYLVWLYVM